MIDLMLQIGLSNACVALLLAILAITVGARFKRPQLSHLLWLLVFVKLLTPPLITIPLGTVADSGHESLFADAEMTDPLEQASPISGPDALAVLRKRELASLPSTGAIVWSYLKSWLPVVWLLGSLVVLTWSLVRVVRFHRLLATESELAATKWQMLARKIARRLGLRGAPAIYATSARISPMVWWVGGRVRVIVPTILLEEMETEQSHWVLAHELAHVRRRDYLVRWLEWLVCVCFWWNPMVGWAQRNLREMEEICCDSLVLSSLRPKPHAYANALLDAVEYLACPAIRPPAMASEINSGGFLKRRVRMIVSKTPSRVSSWQLKGAVLLLAAVVLPLSAIHAQENGAEGYQKQVLAKLEAQVAAGQLSLEEALQTAMVIGKLKSADEKWNAGKAADKSDAKRKEMLSKLKLRVAAADKAALVAREQMEALLNHPVGESWAQKVQSMHAIELAAKELEAAVAAGLVSEAYAKAKYKAFHADEDHGSWNHDDAAMQLYWDSNNNADEQNQQYWNEEKPSEISWNQTEAGRWELAEQQLKDADLSIEQQYWSAKKDFDELKLKNKEKELHWNLEAHSKEKGTEKQLPADQSALPADQSVVQRDKAVAEAAVEAFVAADRRSINLRLNAEADAMANHNALLNANRLAAEAQAQLRWTDLRDVNREVEDAELMLIELQSQYKTERASAKAIEAKLIELQLLELEERLKAEQDQD